MSVRLPEELKQQIDHLARLSRRSRSFIVQDAIEAYVRDRTAWMRDMDEAVKSAESGTGHSAEQIFDWMNSWGTDNELPSPSPDIKPLGKS